MTKAYRNQKLLDAAEGQPCANCGGCGTTVAAHANRVSLGKGIGMKCPDMFVAELCVTCHALVDGRIGRLTKEEKWELWVSAYLKTVKRWFETGVVQVR